MFFKLDLNRQVAWGLGPHVPWCIEEFTKKAGLKEEAPEKNGCPEGTTDLVIPASPAAATTAGFSPPRPGPQAQPRFASARWPLHLFSKPA